MILLIFFIVDAAAVVASAVNLMRMNLMKDDGDGLRDRSDSRRIVDWFM